LKHIRVLAVVSLLVVSLFAVGGIARAQQSQTGNTAIAGLIDVVVNNVQALNQANVLSNVLNESDVRILNLNDSLNGNQINVLSDILNQSQVLSNNTVTVQNVLNNNEIVKNVLNHTNIAIDRVVAVDLLSAPITVYTFESR
jgi:hypothetical protein